MSLEQALIENTATMKQLIAVMASAVEAGGVDAPAGDTNAAAGEAGTTGKRTRRTKAEIEADKAAAAAAAAGTANVQVALLPGDAPGTRYFDIPASSTTYKQAPGMPDCTLPGAIIVSGTEYAAKTEQYAKNAQAAAAASATNAGGQASAASTAAQQSSTTGSVPTIESITSKLMAIHKRDGNAGVAPILQKFGVANVPALATKNLAEVDAAVEAALNPSANLFG